MPLPEGLTPDDLVYLGEARTRVRLLLFGLERVAELMGEPGPIEADWATAPPPGCAGLHRRTLAALAHLDAAEDDTEERVLAAALLLRELDGDIAALMGEAPTGG